MTYTEAVRHVRDVSANLGDRSKGFTDEQQFTRIVSATIEELYVVLARRRAARLLEAATVEGANE